MASLRGSSCARTAYFCVPNTCTWATPLTMDKRCATVVCAASSTSDRRIVDELRARYSTGWSAGFTFWYEGGEGISGGSWESVLAIIACTSCAAASILRSSVNCSVMLVEPSALDEVMESTPAIVENCFSRGRATADAIVSGLAPGSDAVTRMVGKS